MTDREFLSDTSQSPSAGSGGCFALSDRPAALEDVTRTFRTKVRACSCGCWLFTDRDRYGYAHYKWNGKRRVGHRWLYERLVGPIGDDMTLDHLCDRHRNCVNPDHLEQVSLSENSRRANARRKQQGGYGPK